MVRSGILYRKNHKGIYLRCLRRKEAKKMLEEFRKQEAIKHGSRLTTAHQMLQAGYY